jgi:hypothetical protein
MTAYRETGDVAPASRGRGDHSRFAVVSSQLKRIVDDAGLACRRAPRAMSRLFDRSDEWIDGDL